MQALVSNDLLLLLSTMLAEFLYKEGLQNLILVYKLIADTFY